ncbi:MAG: transcriptional regulator, partial [Actinophytocola sp.]|nr:transcriptional regulator [Actinophytocola sp.]
TVQLLPYSAGGHAAAGGPFSILRFPEADLPDVVYMEQLTSSLYLDKREDVERYLAVMSRLSVQAERPERTPGLLTAQLAKL